MQILILLKGRVPLRSTGATQSSALREIWAALQVFFSYGKFHPHHCSSAVPKVLFCVFQCSEFNLKHNFFSPDCSYSVHFVENFISLYCLPIGPTRDFQIAWILVRIWWTFRGAGLYLVPVRVMYPMSCFCKQMQTTTYAIVKGSYVSNPQNQQENKV